MQADAPVGRKSKNKSKRKSLIRKGGAFLS